MRAAVGALLLAAGLANAAAQSSPLVRAACSCTQPQPRVGLTPPQSRLRSALRPAPASSAPLTKPTPPHRQQAAVAGSTNLPDSFVKVKDGRFVVGEQCKEFYFAGWNMCASPRLLVCVSPGLTRPRSHAGGKLWS